MHTFSCSLVHTVSTSLSLNLPSTMFPFWRCSEGSSFQKTKQPKATSITENTSMSLYRHFLLCHVSIPEKTQMMQNLALKNYEANNKTRLKANYSKHKILSSDHWQNQQSNLKLKYTSTIKSLLAFAPNQCQWIFCSFKTWGFCFIFSYEEARGHSIITKIFPPKISLI